jgi:hypothetical protein
MNTYYVTLKGIQATEVNVHAGFYSSGLPALTALCGMTHALQLRCAKLAAPADDFGFDDEPQTLSIAGTALSIVEHRVAAGPAKRTNSLAGDATVAATAASFAYDPLADLRFELVLEVQTEGSRGFVETLVKSGDFRITFNALRLSGGALRWDGDAKVFLNALDALADLDNRGFLVQDEYTTLEKDLEDQPDVLEALIARLARPNLLVDQPGAGEPDSKANPTETKADTKEEAVPETVAAPETLYKPMYVPLAIGFQSLTPLASHAQAKKGYEHRFVEPVLSLGRLRLAASVKRHMKEERPRLFWAHQAPEDGAYLVRAH